MAGPVADKADAGVIYAPSFQENVYQGAHGNESVVEGFAVLKNVAVSTEVRLLSLPIGLRINSVQLVTDALGAGVTVTIKSGAQELVHEADVHGKTTQLTPVKPYTTQSDGELLTAVLGGAVASGEMNILVRYTTVGY
ncbi:hypothetical protein CJ745_21400 [Salmonella enterica subsp. enterica]|uniref:Uncharacterized protein n=1 Tax=Salmonella enterica subsp. houtenae serovar 45:g,z51:- TaxID=1967611 RepID=A0A736VLZ3_SALHO|nr:hypothetical protein [Salmonella enterica]EAW1477786.1 hypothetical protein [Salmonella enterica subsp. enterica]ECG1392075.1 hypothetical protein [Salmonella enterica subsp. houtenae str. CFSAN000557]EED9463107.1 hypothetical protein [Salmonella enterica subsp. enterica serovar Abaetetuba]HAE7767551.1 hypothetical protein [Salmonella enterica subsp. houtenae serovar 45:g,z51:-]